MSKMMRVAGRGEDGKAKAIATDNNGVLKVQESDYKKRINKILDLIGLDNLAYFLTFQEEDGRFRDLIDKNIVFKGLYSGNRYYRVAGGPLGYYISNKGELNQILMLDSDMAFWEGDSTPTVAKKYATKLSYSLGYIGSVATAIKKIGDVSPVKFILYTDNNGKPGERLEQYDEIFINGRQDPIISNIAEEYREVSTPFITGVGLTRGTDYWLVMEYEDDANIDANNYVQWRYGEDASGARAVWNGEDWVVTQGESFNYKLFPETIQIPNDFTISALIKTEVVAGEMALITMTDSKGDVVTLNFQGGTLRVRTPHTYTHNYRPLSPLSNWSVITATFDQYAFRDKVKVYQNGVLIGGVTREINPSGYTVRRGVDGAGGLVLPRIGSISVGLPRNNFGTTYGRSIENIGALFVAKRVFSEKEVAETARLMLGGAI